MAEIHLVPRGGQEVFDYEEVPAILAVINQDGTRTVVCDGTPHHLIAMAASILRTLETRGFAYHALAEFYGSVVEEGGRETCIHHGRVPAPPSGATKPH